MFLSLAMNYSTNYLWHNVLWSTTRSGRTSPLDSIVIGCLLLWTILQIIYDIMSYGRCANLDYWNQKQDQRLLTCIWKRWHSCTLRYSSCVDKHSQLTTYLLVVTGYLWIPKYPAVHIPAVFRLRGASVGLFLVLLILHRCFLTPGLSPSSRFLLPSTGTSDLLLRPLPFLLRGGSEGEGGGRKTQDPVAETPS